LKESIAEHNDRPIQLTAAPHPFSSHRDRHVFVPGGSLADMLSAAGLCGAPSLVVFVDDRLVTEAYGTIYPPQGALISVRVLPGSGGNGQYKNMYRIVAQIAVLAVATYVGGPAGAFIGIMGSLAINALIPPPTADVEESSGGTSNERSYAIAGTRNSILRFGCVPRVFGRARIFPPFAAVPYTEIRGGSQWVREIFCLGPGPLDKSQLKIGDTDAAEFDGFEYEFLIGSQPSVLYPTEVTQTDLNISLPTYVYYSGGGFGFDHSAVPWTVQTTALNAREIEIDLTIPGLFYLRRDGYGRCRIDIFMIVQVALHGSGTWETVGAAHAPVGENMEVIPGQWIMVSGSDPTTIRASLHWTMPAPGQYDVRIKRNMEFITGSTDGWQYDASSAERTVDDVYWTALRSFGNGDPVLLKGPVSPNNPLIEFVAIRVRATEQLNGTIDTFNLVCQAHHPVYNGSAWSIQATRNPAWAFASVLTDSANKRALPYSRLSADNLLAFAQACTAAGFTFDAVVTSRASVLELIRQIASVGKASPTLVDGKYGVVRDIAQSVPVQMFTPRNSWDYKGQRVFENPPHALRCKFIDADGQPDERMVYDDGYNESTATVIESMDMVGVSTPEHAWKLGRYHLAVMRLRPEAHRLSVDIEHLVCTRGDLVRIGHDGPAWGLSWGRIRSVAVNGTDVTIVLDETVTMAPGTDYGIRVRTLTGSVACQITTMPGETNVLTCTLPPASSAMLAPDDLLCFGLLNSESVEVIVKEIVPGPDLSATIYFVDAAPAVHSADSGTIPPFDPHITLPVNWEIYPPPAPSVGRIVSDESVMEADPNGLLMSRMVVNFSAPAVTGLSQPQRVQVQYRLAEESDAAVTRANSTSYALGVYMVPNPANGSWYECITAGTSAAAPPTFTTTPGQTVADGSVTWVCLGGIESARRWRDAEIVSYDSGTAVVFPVAIRETYEVRLRFFSAQDVPGPWTVTSHTIVGGTNPPGTPTGIGGEPYMNGLRIYWSNAPEIDFSHWRHRIRIEAEAWSAWRETDRAEVFIFLDETQADIYANGATVYLELIAVDLAGNISGTATFNGTTGAVWVPPTAIQAIGQLSGAFTEIPVLVGDAWTNNSPVAGQVAWSAHELWYSGTRYTIAAGNTALRYIYWVNAAGSYSASATPPTLGAGDFLIAENISGIVQKAWDAAANRVIGSAYIKNAAILTAMIGDLQVTTAKIGALQVTNAKISELDGAKITAGTLVITSAASATVPDNAIGINGTSIGFHTTGSTWPVRIWNDGGVGKFYCGDGANRYFDWDGSNLKISTDQSEAIKVLSGGDIRLIGDATNPGKLIFQGTNNSVEMFVGLVGEDFYIGPTTDGTVDFTIGGMPYSELYYENATVMCRRQLKLSSNYAQSDYADIYLNSDASTNNIRFTCSRSFADVTSFGLYNDGTTREIRPGSHKTLQLGNASFAFDEAYADNWNNVADYYHLDRIRDKDGTIIEIDDVEVIKAIKAGSKIDARTGMTLINDSTLAPWLVTRHKTGGEERAPQDFEPDGRWHWVTPGDRVRTHKSGDVAVDPDGKPYLSTKVLDSLLLGAVRRIDARLAALEAKLN
jgi:hypothetical protein